MTPHSRVRIWWWKWARILLETGLKWEERLEIIRKEKSTFKSDIVDLRQRLAVVQQPDEAKECEEEERREESLFLGEWVAGSRMNLLHSYWVLHITATLLRSITYYSGLLLCSCFSLFSILFLLAIAASNFFIFASFFSVSGTKISQRNTYFLHQKRLWTVSGTDLLLLQTDVPRPLSIPTILSVLSLCLFPF